MPKPAYRIILGVFLLAFVAASCGDKKAKGKEAPADTVITKPVDPGTIPVDPGTSKPDTLKKDTMKLKPVDPGT